MEIKAEIGISIFNRSVNTSFIRVAIVISASIVVVTEYRDRGTSVIRTTIIGITLIFIVTSIRSISQNTSFLGIAMGIMTIIRTFTLIRDINIDTSRVRATIIFSTFIIIIAFYLFVFTRPELSTIGITSFSGTFVIIITVNFTILTSVVGITSYWMTSIFVFTNIRFIFTTA
jgi:hypothetical protein